MSDEMIQFVLRQEFEGLIKQYFSISPKTIDDYYRRANGDYIDTAWHEMRNYENLEDLFLLNCLESLEPFKGQLFILTDSQY